MTPRAPATPPTDAAAAPPPTAAISLGYAPFTSRRRRWAARVRRWWPAFLLAVVAGLAVAYGPRLYHRYQLLRLQDACLTAAMPEDPPVTEIDPAAAKALIAARPDEYRSGANGAAVRCDPRWAALAAELALPPWPTPYGQTGRSWATEFCHERHTPDGRRRLVVFEDGGVTVIEPIGWFGGGDRPKVLSRGEVKLDKDSMAAFMMAIYLWEATDRSGPSRFPPAVPDPVDRSRFNMSFVLKGVAGTLEFRLGNEDRVTMRVANPDGFQARAQQRTATQK